MPPDLTEAEVFAAATPVAGTFAPLEARARVWCPKTRGLAALHLGMDRYTGLVQVTRCEHYGPGPVPCDQPCVTPVVPG